MRPSFLARSGWVLLACAVLVPSTPGPAAAAGEASAFLHEVAAASAERERAVRQVEADVVVGVDSPQWAGAGTCEGRLVARRPGALRLRGYAAVMTVFDAVTDGARFGVLLPGANLMYVGPAGRTSTLVGLPVDPATIVAALFGEPYGAHGAPRAIDGPGGRWAAWDLADGSEVRARFRAGPTLVERAELWQEGRRTATLAYHDYRRRRGTWWPTRIEFDGGAAQGRLVLDFTEVRFDHAPPDAAFTLPAPEGAIVVDLEAAEADTTGAAWR